MQRDDFLCTTCCQECSFLTFLFGLSLPEQKDAPGQGPRLAPAGDAVTSFPQVPCDAGSSKAAIQLFQLLPDGEARVSSGLSFSCHRTAWSSLANSIVKPFCVGLCVCFVVFFLKVGLFLAGIRSLILFTTLPAHVAVQPGGREMCQRCGTVFQHQRGRFGSQKFGALIGHSVI